MSHRQPFRTRNRAADLSGYSTGDLSNPPGNAIHIVRPRPGLAFCETCRRYMPRPKGVKLMKGWSCGECKGVKP